MAILLFIRLTLIQHTLKGSKKMKHSFSMFSIGIISYACMSHGFAAQAIDLNHQSVSVLQTFMTGKPRLAATAHANQSSLKELTSSADFNQTTHVRVQETYAGYPVWGSDAVVHIPQGHSKSLAALAARKEPSDVTMSGTVFQGLSEDLTHAPAYLFQPAQADKALQQATYLFQSKKAMKYQISQSQSSMMIYVDKNNKAHWAYLISFFADPQKGMPAIPTFIMDAASLDVYERWNNLKTLDLDTVPGGGIGGNEGKVDKLYYDGAPLPHHLPKLEFQRNNKTKTCYLQNELTIIKDVRKNNAVPHFSCNKVDSTHSEVYWNTTDDKANGGYSPNNDALYSDKIVRQMYKEWFDGINMLEKNGKAMQVIMHIHDPKLGQNAFYENGEMTFGDGDDESYPLTAPSVVAHEMSHGFTEQHSNLVYANQSGALNESFSDMADKAVQYYVDHSNNWIIDDELLKIGGKPLRWMDTPEKDGVSINHVDQYNKLLSFCKEKTPDEEQYQSCIVHFASGIFNKVFTIISTKWNNDTEKAFKVMTQANLHYWTQTIDYNQAACGVVKATKDYKYDVATVVDAMNQVGIDASKC